MKRAKKTSAAAAEIDSIFAGLDAPAVRYLPSEQRPGAAKYLAAAPKPTAGRLSDEDLEIILDQIVAGVTLTELASRYGCSTRWVCEFLDHPSRSARVIEARRMSARIWDELAEQEIRNAAGEITEIARARDLASHYRWRAAAIAPREYGKAGLQEAIDPTLGALATIGAAAMREQLAAMVGALGIGQSTVVAVQPALPALEAPKPN